MIAVADLPFWLIGAVVAVAAAGVWVGERRDPAFFGVDLDSYAVAVTYLGEAAVLDNLELNSLQQKGAPNHAQI